MGAHPHGWSGFTAIIPPPPSYAVPYTVTHKKQRGSSAPTTCPANPPAGTQTMANSVEYTLTSHLLIYVGTSRRQKWRNGEKKYEETPKYIMEGKGKLGAHAIKRVAAGAHFPSLWLFEPAKRPDDRADNEVHVIVEDGDVHFFSLLCIKTFTA